MVICYANTPPRQHCPHCAKPGTPTRAPCCLHLSKMPPQRSKVTYPQCFRQETGISHLAGCQVSHRKERDLPVSWHPCWQGQQSGKQDPLTHQGKPWGRVSKTPVRFFFFFFRLLGVERRQPSLCSESKAVYFHAFKRQNHLSPHKGKKREDGRGLRASLARQPQSGGWGLGAGVASSTDPPPEC